MNSEDVLAAVRAAAELEGGPGVIELMSLDRRIAVVTGGAGPGLGGTVVSRLASLGASVVAADIDVDAATQVAEAAQAAHGVRCLGLRCDLTDPASIQVMIDSVTTEFGRLDILVNNVGLPAPKPFLEHSIEDIDYSLAVNLLSVLYASRIAALQMVAAGGGSIVNVSSVAANEPCTGSAVYGAAKGAINTFTRYLSCELSRHGIRVNAVAPGLMASSRHVGIMTELGNVPGALYPRLLGECIERTPLGRPSNAAEVANVVAFLVSDAASYVQGAVWDVNGGMN